MALLVAGTGLIVNSFSVDEAPISVGSGGSSSVTIGSGTVAPSSGSPSVPSSSVPSSSSYYRSWDMGDILQIIFLSPISWIIAIGLAAWLIHRSRRAAGHAERHKGLFERISPISALLASILTLALVVLFSRIWIDLADVVSVGSRPRGAPEELAALFTHTLFVLGVLVIAFLLYFAMNERRKQFVAIVMPYFVASLIFAAWLLIDTAIFTFSNLGGFGIYAVLFFVVFLFSALLYYSQDWEHKKYVEAAQVDAPEHEPNS